MTNPTNNAPTLTVTEMSSKALKAIDNVAKNSENRDAMVVSALVFAARDTSTDIHIINAINAIHIDADKTKASIRLDLICSLFGVRVMEPETGKFETVEEHKARVSPLKQAIRRNRYLVASILKRADQAGGLDEVIEVTSSGAISVRNDCLMNDDEVKEAGKRDSESFSSTRKSSKSYLSMAKMLGAAKKAMGAGRGTSTSTDQGLKAGTSVKAAVKYVTGALIKLNTANDDPSPELLSELQLMLVALLETMHAGNRDGSVDKGQIETMIRAAANAGK